MKRQSLTAFILHATVILIISELLTSCKKDENPVKFPFGIVPDTVTVAIEDLNSTFDDYNLDVFKLYSSAELIFSSNRNSSGGQFDIIQGALSFIWDQTSAAFGYGASVTTDPFLTALLAKANTEGDDYGPYRFFSTVDGYQYMLLSSENPGSGLDFYFLKNLPPAYSQIPNIHGPYPATLLNTSGDDAYISFDLNQDTAVFSSDHGGNFDIYTIKRPADQSIEEWLSGSYSQAATVDSLNSPSSDKCPFIFKNVIVFASDRPGGIGGYDLYYAFRKNGKWSTPENFGPDVNSAYDEYRPIIGRLPDFSNYLLLFSSNKPGGKGGFDLYFRGVSVGDGPVKSTW